MTKTEGTMEELIDELRTRGAWAAYRASREVCDNPQAPANARVQGASNILRAAGYFTLKSDDGAKKEPSEMSYEELSRATAAAIAGLSSDPPAEQADEEEAPNPPAEAEPSAPAGGGKSGVFD